MKDKLVLEIGFLIKFVIFRVSSQVQFSAPSMPLDKGFLWVSYCLFEGGFVKFDARRVEVDLVDGGESLLEVIEVGKLQVIDCPSSIISNASSQL